MYTFAGRDFTDKDIEMINKINSMDLYKSRTAVARAVCDLIRWRNDKGQPHASACLRALTHLEKRGLVKLPPKKRGAPIRAGVHAKRTSQCEPPSDPVLIANDDLQNLTIQIISSEADGALFSEFIDRYHPNGYRPLVGKSLRYIVRDANNSVLAVLGFAAAAWRLEDRETHIGWDDATRSKGLKYIVNNSRFLILPWVQAPNLASHILGLVSRQISEDWLNKFGYKPAMLETFVDSEIHKGTCYQAANWITIGKTKGRGRYGKQGVIDRSLKDILIYPLRTDYREFLCQTEENVQYKEPKKRRELMPQKLSRYRQLLRENITNLDKMAFSLINENPLLKAHPSEQMRRCGQRSCKCYTMNELHGPYKYLNLSIQGKQRNVAATQYNDEIWNHAVQYQDARKTAAQIKEVSEDIIKIIEDVLSLKTYELGV